MNKEDRLLMFSVVIVVVMGLAIVYTGWNLIANSPAIVCKENS